jgi:hypothetical protein
MNKNRFKQLLESTMGNVKPLILEQNKLTMNDFPFCVRNKGQIVQPMNGYDGYIEVKNAGGPKTDYRWYKNRELVKVNFDLESKGQVVSSELYHCKCDDKKCVPKVITYNEYNKRFRNKSLIDDCDQNNLCK